MSGSNVYIIVHRGWPDDEGEVGQAVCLCLRRLLSMFSVYICVVFSLSGSNVYVIVHRGWTGDAGGVGRAVGLCLR